MQHIAAAFELIAGDSDIGEKNCDRPENTGGLVIARHKQVGQGELGKFAGARRDEVDKQQRQPASCGLP